MGFRTVVMLCNDQAHQWGKDAELGEKILHAMHFANHPSDRYSARVDNYGQVVQCIHADSQTLAILDGYTNFHWLAGKGWTRGEEQNATALRLVKDAADTLGFRLVKKSIRPVK